MTDSRAAFPHSAIPTLDIRMRKAAVVLSLISALPLTAQNRAPFDFSIANI
nr:hypothetical protein [Gemmatimonadaceae bacterium]